MVGVMVDGGHQPSLQVQAGSTSWSLFHRLLSFYLAALPSGMATA
jgi:hypothetical protein